jgi:hypothetical protein
MYFFGRMAFLKISKYFSWRSLTLSLEFIVCDLIEVIQAGLNLQSPSPPLLNTRRAQAL